MKISELFLREGDYDRDDTSSWLTDEIVKELYDVTQGTIKKNFVGDLIAQSQLLIGSRPQLKKALLEKVAGGYELKYPISLVSGELDVNQCQLISFKNFPYTVRGNLSLWNNKITSLEGIPKIIDGSLDLIDNPITSFHNIHTMITEVSKIYVPTSVSSCLLGVLKIKKPPLLSTASVDRKNTNYPILLKAVSIINKYQTSNDIIACQRELIENDLDEYAEL